MKIHHLIVAAASTAAALSATAFSGVEYYVGRDARPTVIGGAYDGLPNPNFDRLTLLYAHTYSATPANNHYHGKSNYSYRGPNLGAATLVAPTNGNTAGVPSNFVPEGTFGSSTRIELLPSGGSFVSGLTPSIEFADLRLQATDSLASFDATSSEGILFRAGGSPTPGRYTPTVAGANVSLVVVGITPGLIFAGTLDSVGDTLNIGTLSSNFEFAPTATASTLGDYSIEVRLVDTSGTYLDSGSFAYNFVAIPEPSALSLVAASAVALLARRRA